MGNGNDSAGVNAADLRFDRWSNAVREFPLSFETVNADYTRLPEGVGNVYFHYTTRIGLEGILRSGGLRATFRMEMNDPAEFTYGRGVVMGALDEILSMSELPKVTYDLAAYVKLNLEQFLDSRASHSGAFCACLTSKNDDLGQWRAYAEDGKGFALGIDMLRLFQAQVSMHRRGRPFLFCAPVTYDVDQQRGLVERLFNTAIDDLRRFARTVSNDRIELTCLRNRITSEIVVVLLGSINFFKDPKYQSEAELRLMFDPNDGSVNASNVEYFKRGDTDVPYVLLDLRDPKTGLMPLAGVMIGPSESFDTQRAHVEALLRSHGYLDGPIIWRSRLV